MASNLCHRKLLSLLSKQDSQLTRLYSEKAKELASVLKKYKSTSKENVWKGNAALEKEVDKILINMDDQFKSYLLQNMSVGQNLSNDCIDAQVYNYIKGMDLTAKQREQFFYRDGVALASWLKERKKGLDLSSRVWKLDEQSKEQMEHFIKSGLSEGRDAASLARDIQQYLIEPDKRFRRIRNPETGKLMLSQPAKDYHPGRGVYRSSYQNALRVARNEINIAYRSSDHERVKNLNFVKGIRVNLSNAHPRFDICDELVGVYPKGFKFLGWHPNCLCYTTTVLMTQEEFINYMNTGERKTQDVTTIPKRAEKHLNAISSQIKGWSNKPYFIRDNFKNTKDGFTLKKGVVPLATKTKGNPEPPKPIPAPPKIDPKDLPNELKEPVFQYTSNYGLNLNYYLRTGELPRGVNTPIEKVNDDIVKINSALALSKKYEGVTHRGMGFESSEKYSAFAKKIKSGSIMSDKAFMSTTYDTNIIDSFASTRSDFRDTFGSVIKVKGKSGVKIDEISQISSEREVLFAPNTRFVVEDVKEVKDGRLTTLFITIIEL